MKPRTAYLTLGISVAVNVLLLLGHLDIPSGGGQYETSPNGVFVASVNSLRNSNPFGLDKRIYSEMTVRRGGSSSPPLVSIIVRPERVTNEMEFRAIDDLISWSDDSTSVVFQTPSGKFQISVPESKWRLRTTRCNGLAMKPGGVDSPVGASHWSEPLCRRSRGSCAWRFSASPCYTGNIVQFSGSSFLCWH